MRIEWSTDIGAAAPALESRALHDEKDLERILDEIGRSAAEPVVAELVAPDGARLGIGVGGPMSVLAFNPSSDPPYFLSVGDGGTRDEDAVFYLHGHWTEFPATALLPNPAAREAARQFVSTGERPEKIEWEEV